jgi:hypothetical protein
VQRDRLDRPALGNTRMLDGVHVHNEGVDEAAAGTGTDLVRMLTETPLESPKLRFVLGDIYPPL